MSSRKKKGKKARRRLHEKMFRQARLRIHEGLSAHTHWGIAWVCSPQDEASYVESARSLCEQHRDATFASIGLTKAPGVLVCILTIPRARFTVGDLARHFNLPATMEERLADGLNSPNDLVVSYPSVAAQRLLQPLVDAAVSEFVGGWITDREYDS